MLVPLINGYPFYTNYHDFIPLYNHYLLIYLLFLNTLIQLCVILSFRVIETMILNVQKLTYDMLTLKSVSEITCYLYYFSYS